MNSSATGMMPEEMMASTQAPAISLERNAASIARAPSGERRMRTVTSVTTAKLALAAGEQAEPVVAGGVEMRAADVQDLAVDRDDLQARAGCWR